MPNFTLTPCERFQKKQCVPAGMNFAPSILSNVKPNIGPLFGVTFLTIGPADAAETVIDRLIDVAVCAGEEESVAARVAEYALPTVPPGREVVVTETAGPERVFVPKPIAASGSGATPFPPFPTGPGLGQIVMQSSVTVSYGESLNGATLGSAAA